MWASAISNMIIKAADNMNRGVENASDAGEGNNGVDYSSVNSGTPESTTSGGGYQKPAEQDTSGVQGVSSAANKLKDIGKDALSNIGKGDEGENKEEQTPDTVATSDERLKRIFGDDEDAIKCFAKIDAIKFEYNDKAKEIHPNGEHQVDDDPHYGVKAQDLLENPLTASTVEKDESGYLAVNTPELTLANSAILSEICKRLLIIEKVLGIKVV